MRILVADHNQTNRKILVDLINKQGDQALEAISGTEVLQHCKTKCPDLCLIAINLSGTSGIELIKQIRQLGGVAVWNPMILLVEQLEQQQLQIGIAAGADDFLLQPVDQLRLAYKIAATKRHAALKDQIFDVAHDLILANRALENVVNTDGLTGLADLNTFKRALEAEWYNCKETNNSLAIVIIGLDCFKRYNALYGASAGDESIVIVARAIEQILNELPRHTLARTVGESFAVLLPGQTAVQASVVAQQLITAVLDLAIVHADSKCSKYLTASAGFAAIEQEQFTSPLELLEAADHALYIAKHNGRNQIYGVTVDLKGHPSNSTL